MLGKIFMLLNDPAVLPSLRTAVMKQLTDHVNGYPSGGGHYCNLTTIYARLSSEIVQNRLLVLSCAA